MAGTVEGMVGTAFAREDIVGILSDDKPVLVEIASEFAQVFILNSEKKILDRLRRAWTATRSEEYYPRM